MARPAVLRHIPGRAPAGARRPVTAAACLQMEVWGAYFFIAVSAALHPQGSGWLKAFDTRRPFSAAVCPAGSLLVVPAAPHLPLY